MIQPINQNLNMGSSQTLKPVEVPHFRGLTKIEKVDSFSKASKSPSFKQQAKDFMDTAKKGAKEGVDVMVDATKKGAEFTKALFKSLYTDTKEVVKARGANTITNIDGII